MSPTDPTPNESKVVAGPPKLSPRTVVGRASLPEVPKSISKAAAEALRLYEKRCHVKAEREKFKTKVEAKAAAETPQARRTRWEVETKRYKEIQAELEAKYGAKENEAAARLSELDTKRRESPSSEMEDEYWRTYKECRQLTGERQKEEEPLLPLDDEAAARGPLFSYTAPGEQDLTEIINLQIQHEGNMKADAYAPITSGIQELIDGKRPPGSLDKIVWERLCFLQAQIDAKREGKANPSISKKRVQATLERMRDLKAMLEAAKLPPDAEMRGPLFDNREAGQSLSFIISLQLFRERNENGEFKPVFKSGLRELINGKGSLGSVEEIIESLGEEAWDRMCFLCEYFAAKWDKGWNEDPLSQQKRDGMIGKEIQEIRRREQEQRTKQNVQTILQHMRQQRAAGQPEIEFSMELPCLTSQQAQGFFTDCPPLQIDAKDGNIVPFPTRAAANTGAVVVPGTPAFRDLTRGKARASLANAVIAIKALGIEIRQDLFHHRIIVKHQGDTSTIQDGPLTDDTVGAIRSLINNTYQIDCGVDHTLAAVKEIARENAFNPMLDYLAKCQGEWDGKNRNDTWVINYLGAEDTPLNRAMGSLMLIASVRRARVPGCKFDQICVLEDREGTGKSTAIKILAGAENFSDQSVLNVSEREAQEQLEGVWLHELADLTGLKKAEVERVKAFASRQVDRARPAYGRVREDRPRCCTQWATTNDTEYLASQTGNRRFWPLKVGRIDLDALRRDRDQLWGEAAMLEAAGSSIVLDSKLWADAGEEQEKRRIVDTWEDIIENMPIMVMGPHAHAADIKIIYQSEGKDLVSSADVLTHVLNVPIGQQHPEHGRRLARAMKRCGWQTTKSGRVRIRGKQFRGYWREPPPTVIPTEWLDRNQINEKEIQDTWTTHVAEGSDNFYRKVNGEVVFVKCAGYGVWYAVRMDGSLLGQSGCPIRFNSATEAREAVDLFITGDNSWCWIKAD